MRWDVNSHMAIKVQLDSTHIHPDGYGLWYHNEDQNLKNSRVTLFSATIDFVY